MQIPREHLYTRKQSHPKINWSEFLCTNEELQDFEVVTLKSEILHRCREAAFKRIPPPRGPSTVEDEYRWLQEIQKETKYLYKTIKVKAYETVNVKPNYDTVVTIDAEKITDKEIDRALILLEIAAKSGRVPGITYFNKGEIINVSSNLR